MGLGGISIWQLLIVLGIVVVIFGTGRLRSIGSDLGGAIKGFRKAMNDGETNSDGSDEKTASGTPSLEADPKPEGSQASERSGEHAGERRTDGAS